MAWSIGPLRDVASEADADEKIDEAFDGHPDATTDDEHLAKGNVAAVQVAKRAVKALIKSGAAGEAPFEVSVAAHPSVPRSGSRPYVSVSVVGASPRDSG